MVDPPFKPGKIPEVPTENIANELEGRLNDVNQK